MAAVAALCACAAAPRHNRSSDLSVTPFTKAVVRTARAYLPGKEKARRAPKDCSDFVRKVFIENGINLPRTSLQMSVAGQRIKSSWNLRPGDLVFFSGERVSRVVGHVGIYVGGGMFIHRPRRGSVVLDSLHSGYYRVRYLTARRVGP